MRPIGIFGGMFDPIHLGHLRPALEVAEALDLEQVRVVPCGEPPHRAAPVASAELRCRLIAAAIVDEPRFVLDRRELERRGPHYTVDTLTALRTEFGAARPLVLLIGGDAFAGLDRWHRWTELLGLAHLAVMLRPGSVLPDAAPLGELLRQHRTSDPAAIAGRSAGQVWVGTVTGFEISSTALRERVARGGSVRWLVGDGVWELMRSSGAYRMDREG